jgi:hypothetical protein
VQWVGDPLHPHLFTCMLMRGWREVHYKKPNFLGWVIDPKERDWQFRISLYYAADEDSNTFQCKTPRGKLNSINVVVTGNTQQNK